VAKKNVEQQLAATLEALESSNNKITELESLLSVRDEQMAELTQVNAKNSALEDELSLTRAKLAETTDCVEHLNKECSQLKESEMNCRSSADKMVYELQESLDATKKQLSVVEDERQSAASHLEHVQWLLNDSAEKYSSLARAHAALQSDFDGMKQAFDQLKQGHLCSNDHTAAVVEECTVLKDTVENLTVQHDSILAEKQALCQEMTDLRKSLHVSVEQHDKLKAREDMLCRGVADLNCALSDKMLESHVDDASLLSYSDSDVQNILSAILTKVTGLQNQLELNVQQVQDEWQLRAKVEREMAALMQESDVMHDSIQSLQEENVQLSSTCKQLESSQAELSAQCNTYSGQVVQLQMELEAAQTSTHNVEEITKSAACLDATLLQKSVVDKDAEIERLCQEVKAYKLDIERLEQERELHAVNQQTVQSSLSSTLEKRDDENQSLEFDDNVETRQRISDADSVKSGQETVVSETMPSGPNVELLTDGKDELVEMKEKMTEWEAMMTMLQTERDEIQAELQKLERQEKHVFCTVDEVLQRILSSMKGRDLFPSSSDNIIDDDGCDSEFFNKLALLKTVVDELVFEVDEMKEKVHHITDEVKISEQRVLELEAERNNLKKESKEKSIELQKLRESEDALKVREQELNTEVEQLKSSLSDIAEDLKHKDALLEKIHVLNSDADKLNAEIELLHTKVASKDQLLIDAKVSEEALQESLGEAKEQLRNMELQLSSAESKYSIKVEELQAERDQLSIKVSGLEKDNDSLQLQSSSVTDELKRKYSDKCNEATELHCSVTTYCKQIEELSAEVDLLRTEVASKDQLLNDAKLSEETLQKSLREAKEQLSAVESEYSARVGELQSERDHLSVKISNLQKDSDALLQQSDNDNDDLQKKYSDKCSEATELHSSITAHSKQIEELKEQLKVEVSEKEELNAEHAKLAGASKDLELHSGELRAETNNLSAAKITLEQKLCSLQEETEQKVKLSESQVSQLEISLSTVQMDYTKMCEQKSTVENELADCNQKLAETSTRLSETEEQCKCQTAELLQVRTELEQLKEECRMRADQKSSSCNVAESVQTSTSSGSIEMTADSDTAQV